MHFLILRKRKPDMSTIRNEEEDGFDVKLLDYYD